MDAPEDVKRYDLGERAIGYFARAYADQAVARRAMARAREVIRNRDHTSLFRTIRPSGQPMIILVSAAVEDAKRLRHRIAWGGESTELSEDEIQSIFARIVDLGDAGALRSSADWSGVGGIGYTPRGTTGPLRRAQG